MARRDQIVCELVVLCNSITRKPNESLANFAKRAVETAWQNPKRAPTCIMQVYAYRNGEYLAVTYYCKTKKDLDFLEIAVSELVEH